MKARWTLLSAMAVLATGLVHSASAEPEPFAPAPLRLGEGAPSTGPFRGFKFRDLAPHNPSGTLGGAQSPWRANLGENVPLIDRIRAAVFFDVGSVPAHFDFTIKDVGLRLDLPVAPVRIDYGLPIDKFNSKSSPYGGLDLPGPGYQQQVIRLEQNR
jgi:hypothetical protein